MLNNSKTTAPRYWADLTPLERLEVQQFIKDHGKMENDLWRYDHGWSDIAIANYFNIHRTVIEPQRRALFGNLANESDSKTDDVKAIQLDVAEIKELLRFLVTEWRGSECEKN